MWDVLEIVIATIDLPLGPLPRAEIVINGTALTELVERAEGMPGAYAPLSPKKVLTRLRDALADGSEPTFAHVLGCCCGDDRCGYAHVVVRGDGRTVHWDRVTTSHREDLELGPFEFDRAQYDAALARPREADEPVRDYSD